MSTLPFPITIYHNPACGTSRNVLALIRAAGYEPEVVEYLKAGWTRPLLDRLLTDSGLTPRAVLRTNQAETIDSALLAEGVADETLIAAMLAHPVLVNRPFVVTPLGVDLCRPADKVRALLEQPPPA